MRTFSRSKLAARIKDRYGEVATNELSAIIYRDTGHLFHPTTLYRWLDAGDRGASLESMAVLALVLDCSIEDLMEEDT